MIGSLSPDVIFSSVGIIAETKIGELIMSNGNRRNKQRTSLFSSWEQFGIVFRSKGLSSIYAFQGDKKSIGHCNILGFNRDLILV